MVQGLTLDAAWSGRAGQGTAGLGQAGRGVAGLGGARQGKVFFKQEGFKMSKQAPSFLTQGVTKNPNGNGPRPAPDPIVEKAAEGYDAITKLVDERNKLREDQRFMRDHITALEIRLEQAERDRDYYRKRADHFERFSTEIVVQFATIRMIIDETHRKAAGVAYQKEEPTKPAAPSAPEQPVEDEEAARLRQLANQLEQ